MTHNLFIKIQLKPPQSVPDLPEHKGLHSPTLVLCISLIASAQGFTKCPSQGLLNSISFLLGTFFCNLPYCKCKEKKKLISKCFLVFIKAIISFFEMWVHLAALVTC